MSEFHDRQVEQLFKFFEVGTRIELPPQTAKVCRERFDEKIKDYGELNLRKIQNNTINGSQFRTNAVLNLIANQPIDALNLLMLAYFADSKI